MYTTSTPSSKKKLKKAHILLYGTVGALAVVYGIVSYFFVLRPAANIPQGPSTLCFKETCRSVEIADTQEKRSTGLMGREELASGSGMFFVFEEAGRHGFWMKDTLIPLDILRLDQDYVLVHAATVAPCTTPTCPTYMPPKQSSYVLEIPAGARDAAGLELGDRLSIK